MMKGNINTLAHQVYFWMKNPRSSEDFQALLQGVKSLSSIETITGFHIGIPAATEDRDVIDNSYSIAWLAFFATEDDERNYQNHPTHVKFLADCEHLWRKVVVYDSQNDTTKM